MPTKEELRKKYKITENDFMVLQSEEPPDSETLRKDGAFMQKVGYFERFEVWLKKTIVGQLVLAVIFVGGFAAGVETVAKYGSIIYTSRPQIEHYIAHLADYTKDQAKGLLAHTDRPPTREDIERKEWVIFPTGTNVYPVSGSWQIG